MAFYKSNRLHFKDSRHSRDSIGSRGRKGVHGHQLQIRGTSRLWRFQGFHRFLQVFRASRRFLLKFFGSSSFFFVFLFGCFSRFRGLSRVGVSSDSHDSTDAGHRPTASRGSVSVARASTQKAPRFRGFSGFYRFQGFSGL